MDPGSGPSSGSMTTLRSHLFAFRYDERYSRPFKPILLSPHDEENYSVVTVLLERSDTNDVNVPQIRLYEVLGSRRTFCLLRSNRAVWCLNLTSSRGAKEAVYKVW